MKTRLLCFLVAVCTAALVASAPALAESPAVSAEVAQHYYVALGDSLAEGYQPNGDVGDGYADQLYAALKADDPTLQLANLSCGGETTTSMITGVMPWGGLGSRSFCGYRADSAQLAHGSQLADAVAFLRDHHAFVSLVTIDIGGNDVASCVDFYAINQACVAAGVGTINENLPAIVSALREAAGPDVPIVGMNYYDPFLALWVFGNPALAAATNQFILGQVNPAIEQAYAGASIPIPVADVEAAFSTTDWTLTQYGIPLNVLRICQWTWMCDPDYGPDIHADTPGYAVIAQAFVDVIP